MGEDEIVILGGWKYATRAREIAEKFGGSELYAIKHILVGYCENASSHRRDRGI
jgi:hypothetical protein